MSALLSFPFFLSPLFFDDEIDDWLFREVPDGDEIAEGCWLGTGGGAPALAGEGATLLLGAC